MKQSNKIDLKNGKIQSLFWKYTLPSITMMLIASVYFIVDAMFVGRGIGNDALAAINLCIPLIMIFNSITMALSIGASIVISIRLSRKEYSKANNVFSLLLCINIFFAISFMLLGLFFSEQLAYLLGANEDTISYARDYLSIILYFIPFFTLQNTFSCVVRNDSNPNLSLLASFTSSFINIPLDYAMIFILGWGIKGASLATGFSQLIALFILLTHFIFKKGYLRFSLPKFDAPLFKQKIKNSIPIFVANISMPAILYSMNILSEKYYGTKGLSAFAIMGSISMFVIMIFAGIAQGVQPIISYNFGMKQLERAQQTLKISIFYAIIISISLISLIWVFSENIINLYISNDPELVAFTTISLRIFLLGYFFIGANLLFISFFQSIEKRKIALTISLLRGFIFLGLMAYIIPHIFGEIGIWFVVLASEVSTLIFTLIFYFKNNS